jgi:hypothetical protein
VIILHVFPINRLLRAVAVSLHMQARSAPLLHHDWLIFCPPASRCRQFPQKSAAAMSSTTRLDPVKVKEAQELMKQGEKA